MNDSNLIQSTPTQAQLLHFIINSGLDDNVKKNYGVCRDIKYKTHPKFLKPAICSKLKNFARQKFETHIQEIDSVDNRPEWQVNIGTKTLKSLVEANTYNRLWEISRLSDLNYFMTPFIRRYNIKERREIGLHCDICARTININLSIAHKGNQLCTITKENNTLLFTKHNFNLGDLMIHDDKIAHFLTPIESGTRYSLIIFFQPKSSI